VNIAMADAYARLNQAQQELRSTMIAERVGGRVPAACPIGNMPGPAARPEGSAPRPARSAEYARVLDRYIARLVSLKRIRMRWRLSPPNRSQSERSGLYERLQDFSSKTKWGVEVEVVYHRAMAQFSDRS